MHHLGLGLGGLGSILNCFLIGFFGQLVTEA